MPPLGDAHGGHHDGREGHKVVQAAILLGRVQDDRGPLQGAARIVVHTRMVELFSSNGVSLSSKSVTRRHANLLPSTANSESQELAMAQHYATGRSQVCSQRLYTPNAS